MKKLKYTTKKQIVILTVTSMLLAFIAVIISYNLLMAHYIQKEAQESLSNTVLLLQAELTGEELDDIDYSSSMQVNSLFIDSQFNPTYPFLTEQEKHLWHYMKYHSLKKNETTLIHVNDEDFYVTYVDMPQQNDMYEYLDDVQTVLLYVNVTPLIVFSKSINIVFVLVLAIFTLFAGYFGIRLGKKIENAEEKMTQFFQNVSHELQTPIMSIQGYAEGIELNIIPHHDKAARIIMSESQKMSDLVEELLFLSKMDSGQLRIKREKIDMNELVFDCLRVIEPMAKQKHISIVVTPSDLSPILLGDEKQLTKAVMNILSNAITYAKQRIEVQVTVSKTEVTIRVIDDGNGIDEKDLPYIFQRFYTGEHGNTGIGLALTKEIVEFHKGDLQVINSKQGAVFSMTLPMN